MTVIFSWKIIKSRHNICRLTCKHEFGHDFARQAKVIVSKLPVQTTEFKNSKIHMSGLDKEIKTEISVAKIDEKGCSTKRRFGCSSKRSLEIGESGYAK